MGPLGFGRPRLWIAFLEPSAMMSAQLTQIEDIPRWADPRLCGALLEMCGHIVGRDGGGGSLAFLLTRPGRNPMDDADRSWASGLTSAAATARRRDVASAFCERRRAMCLCTR